MLLSMALAQLCYKVTLFSRILQHLKFQTICVQYPMLGKLFQKLNQMTVTSKENCLVSYLQLHISNTLNQYALLCIVYTHIIIVIVVSSCILVSHINKLKKWLFYIYLLTTITKALYQSSEKGMSLLFTCPQLTVEESSLLAAAARTMAALYCTCYAIYFYQIVIPQFLELWSTFNAL